MLLSILAVVLVFGLIIFVHELGHMLAAKACGVAVPDFSLGMGPSLFRFRIGGTTYHFSALPIGGYARIAGMEGDAADAPGAPRANLELDRLDKADDDKAASGTGQTRHVDDMEPVDPYPDSAKWQSKNGWQKALILVAGPLMNFALALLVMVIVGQIGFPVNAVMIGGVQPATPAAEAGLHANDMVLELAGQPVNSVLRFARIVQDHRGKELAMLVQRDGEQLELSAVPRIIKDFNDDKASLGVSLFEMPISSATIALVPIKTAGYEQGLKVGDVITHVNGKPVTFAHEAWSGFANYDADFNPIDADNNPLGPDDADPIVLVVQRDGEELSFQMPGNTTALSLGVQFQPLLEKLPLGESLLRSAQDARDMLLGVLLSLRLLFTEVGVKSVAGPVGIMSLIGQSAQSGWYSLLQIVILINVFIGVFNLLPVPALDGGRLVFVALNGIGIRIPEQREALIHLVGFMMLIGLIIVITFTDILAFF